MLRQPSQKQFALRDVKTWQKHKARLLKGDAQPGQNVKKATTPQNITPVRRWSMHVPSNCNLNDQTMEPLDRWLLFAWETSTAHDPNQHRNQHSTWPNQNQNKGSSSCMMAADVKCSEDHCRFCRHLMSEAVPDPRMWWSCSVCDHYHNHHILALQIFQRLSSLTPAAWTLTSQKPKLLWLGWIVVHCHHSLSAGGIVASATASLQQNCPVKEFLSIRLVLHVCCKVSGFCGRRTVCQHCKLLLGMPAIVSHNSKSNNPLLCSTSCIEQCAECQPM